MHQLYHISGYAPSAGMGAAGFSVKLWPAFKQAVSNYSPALTQENINRAVATMGRSWLDGHGYDRQVDRDGKMEPLYLPRHSIRVTWGAWGPEHITVPGNACGLDIDDGIFAPRGGRILQPHNVDSLCQASLLLTVFLFFADTLVLDMELKEYHLSAASPAKEEST